MERERQVIQEAMDKNKAFLNLINDIISSSSLMCIVFYLLRVPRYDCAFVCVSQILLLLQSG